METNFLNSTNALYVAELFFKYIEDSNSIDKEWASFFDSLNEDEISVIKDFRGPEWKKRPSKVIEHTKNLNKSNFDKKYKKESFINSTLDSIRALRLIRAYRIIGHLIADLDPLKLQPNNYHSELDYKFYGFTENDLDKDIFIDGSLGLENTSLRNILKILKDTYSASIGVEFQHIQVPEQKQWVQERIEEVRNKTLFTNKGKIAIFDRLLQSELFEKFLDKKFVGSKRYGLIGGESMIPGIEQIVKQACLNGVENIFIGTAHRGRLTLLATVLGMSYKSILSKFRGDLNDPNEFLGSGDVKYHLGASTDREFNENKIHLSLTPNPSHLEAVNPVVMGKVRAKQTELKDKTCDKVFGLLIHGDAAMAGQGVVAETFAMSQLRGFRTGGTIHFVINNQIGFTTMPLYGRSAPYCTEIAKMVQAPIFHVNGDNPEAVVHVCRIATEFRNKFKEDVVVDMFCYRRSGHNESDEPSFTQPLMYQKIKKHPTTLEKYKKQLIDQKILNDNECENKKNEFENFLNNEFENASSFKSDVDWFEGSWSGLSTATLGSRRGLTSIKEKDLISINSAIHKIPLGFNVHKKIERIYKQRKESVEERKAIDWSTAESLAFASLLSEGYGVRLSGQDSGRGTFSQRHAVLYDQINEKRYVPLRHFLPKQGYFEIIDSFLSEMGVLGFEYGYSQADPNTLVLWEAQFGDFANNAQTIIDQFIATGERKWLKMSGLTLLLPHAHEGQGPEHSSSRLERFLQMCAEDNMQIINCTTPANYFHALRRQIHRKFRKPLVILTPKSTLRHKKNISPIEHFTNNSTFHRIISNYSDKKNAKRLLLCSGKIYFELQDYLEESKIKDVFILRLEQLYPFPYEALKSELKNNLNCEIIWVQEEPKNMGAWGFIRSRVESTMKSIKFNQKNLLFIGRKAAASSATGIFQRHLQNQKNIIRLATQAKIDEIKESWEGVSLIKYELPIE